MKIEQRKAFAAQAETEIEVTVPTASQLVQPIPREVVRRRRADLSESLLIADAVGTTDEVAIPNGVGRRAMIHLVVAMMQEVASHQNL